MRPRTPRNKPGQSATAKYNELTRTWQRRSRRKLVLLGAALLLLALLANALVAVLHLSLWFGGVVTGVLAGFFTAAACSPPAWIDNWQDGALGEKRTGEQLAPSAKEGWRILHDLPAEHGNIDHIVVGPGGVFLLDSKRWHGQVTIEADTAIIRRLEDPALSYRYDGAGHVRSLAHQVHKRLREQTHARVWVTPVIIIWGEFPEQVSGERCTFVHGDVLAGWLRSQPQRVAPSRIDQLVAALTG